MKGIQKHKPADYMVYPNPSFDSGFLLIVSRNRAELRKQLARSFKHWERPIEDDQHTCGMFSPTVLTENKNYAGEFSSNIIGTMFLAEDQLSPEYVAHECLHATFTYERFRLKFNMCYSDDCNDDEERVAYYLTACIASVYKILTDNKHLKGTT